MKKLNFLSILVLIATFVQAQPDTTILSGKSWVSAESDYSPVEIDQSAGGPDAGDGGTLFIVGSPGTGKSFATGFGVFANSEIVFHINKEYTKFESWFGIDEWSGQNANVVFEVRADNDSLLFQSDTLTEDSPAHFISLDISLFDTLKLVTVKCDQTGSDWADWGDPILIRADQNLSDLEWVSAENGWGPVERDMSNGPNGAGDGSTLEINGTSYDKGLGVHAYSRITYTLNQSYARFTSLIGIDDWSDRGNTVFNVYLDDSLAFSKVKLFNEKADSIDLNVLAADTLVLEVVNNKGDNGGNHGDWALPVLSKKDCNGDVLGSAYIDECGDCVGGNTGLTACQQDCSGEWGGMAQFDSCGFCTGGTTGITPNALCDKDTTLYLSDLKPLSQAGTVSFDQNTRSNAIKIGGKTYDKGISMTDDPSISYALNSNFVRLRGEIGVDDFISSQANTIFQVFMDDSLAYQSQSFKHYEEAAVLDLNVKDVDTLRLEIIYENDASTNDIGNWGDIRISTSDCNGVINGEAYLDACGVCVGGTTGLEPSSFCSVVQAYRGDTIYVNTLASGSNDGSSWANAYSDLHDALSTAQAGDQIWVAKGVYYPGTTASNSFYLVDSVGVYGGFAGSEVSIDQRDWQHNKAVLSGDITQNDGRDADGISSTINGPNSYHVVRITEALSENSRLDGFYITGGRANGSDDDRYGAGVWISPNSNQRIYAIFANCVFQKNHANSLGGGVAEIPKGNASNTLISTRYINCQFIDNRAGNSNTTGIGGGMYRFSDEDNRVVSEIINCTFTKNVAGVRGAGVLNWTFNGGRIDAHFINCLFYNNAVWFNGNDAATPPAGRGAGMSNSSIGLVKNSHTEIYLTNCTFSNNRSQLSGSAMEGWSENSSTTKIFMYNSIFYGNKKLDRTPNSAIHYGSASQGKVIRQDYSSTFENIDPAFVSETLQNYHLNLTSDNLDDANPAYLPSDKYDIDNDGDINEKIPYDAYGNERIVGALDIGALETSEIMFPDYHYEQFTPNISGPFAFDIVFDKVISGFHPDSITTNYATIDSLITSDSSRFTVYATPFHDNDTITHVTLVLFKIEKGKASDAEGFKNQTETAIEFNFNSDDLVVGLNTASDTVSGSFYVDVSVSELVNSLDITAFDTENLSIDSIQTMSQDLFRVFLTPEQNGDTKLILKPNGIRDIYGNGNAEGDTLNVFMKNEPPTLALPATITINEDEIFAFSLDSLEINDPDSNYPSDHTFEFEGGSNYTIDGNQIIPDANFNGLLIVELIITDNWGNELQTSFELNVLPVNDPPEVISAIEDQSFTIGFQSTSFDLSQIFEDVDNQLSFSATSSDASIVEPAISAEELIISEKGGVGAVQIDVVASDADGEQASLSFQFEVIDKSSQSITFEGIPDKKYGDGPFNLSISTSSGLETSISVTTGQSLVAINGKEVTILGAGLVTVLAEQEGNDAFFDADPVEQTFTIQKAELSVIADDQAITYGNPIPDLTFSYSGFVNGDDASDLDELPLISTSAATDSDAGDYPIILSGGSDDNYTYSLTEGTLTIGQAAQTIVFEEIADVDLAGQSSVSLSASASSGLEVTYSLIEGDGMIEGNILTVNSTGTFTVEASQAGNTNYLSAESVSRSFSVTDSRKDDQTITFESINNLTYGDVFTPVATASSGLPVIYSIVSGPATISDDEVSFTGIGTVTIKATQAGNAEFLAADPVQQTFEVIPATLAVLADDQSTTFNEAIPELRYSISGFVNGEDENVLTQTPVASTTAAVGDDAGTYAITVSGGEANNYAFSYIEGTLTIEKAVATITLTDLEQEADGTAKLPTVTTDPADLTYTITFDGSVDAPKTAGEYLVNVEIDEVNYQGSASGTFILSEVEKILSTNEERVIHIYPNPVESMVNISVYDTKSIYLSDLNGRMLRQAKNGAAEVRWDLSGLAGGVYLIGVIFKDETEIVHRIVKK